MSSRPVFFREQRPLFGWLHEPTLRRRSRGLIICKPFGYEAICTHRTLRQLADAAAVAGFTTLRFDYDGTGDSAGADDDPARVRAWLESINAAIDLVREASGVEHVALFGIRLGALLATAAAAENPAVRWLILAAPVVTGRKYLRELRALSLASTQARGFSHTEPRGFAQSRDSAQIHAPAPTHGAEGISDSMPIESAGYQVDAELSADLTLLDAAHLNVSGIESALVLDRVEMPSAHALLSRWRDAPALTPRARGLPFTHYADMMLDPHDSKVPEQMISDSIAWLGQEVGDLNEDTAASHAHVDTLFGKPALTDRAAQHSLARALIPMQAGSAAVRETAMYFDAEHRLFGILTEPEGAQGSSDIHSNGMPSSIALLLNSGAQPHVGPNRLYVRLARRLATRGRACARVDLSGLGDSAPAAQSSENVIYSASAPADLQKFIETLRSQFPAVPIDVVGICSGAYHALKAAVRGADVRSAVIINPLTFHWQEGMTVTRPDFHLTAEANRYRKSAISAASWAKLLRGGVDIGNLTATLAARVRQLARYRARAAARVLKLPMKDDLAADLRKAAGHGVRMHFVFADTDPGHSMLRAQAGSMPDRLMRARSLSIDFIEQADHTFTPRAAQGRLLDLLEKLFDSTSRERNQVASPRSGA